MNEETLIKLEMTRKLMIRSGIENGLQNPKTIRLSRELDQILNQYRQEITIYNKGSSIKN